MPFKRLRIVAKLPGIALKGNKPTIPPSSNLTNKSAQSTATNRDLILRVLSKMGQFSPIEMSATHATASNPREPRCSATALAMLPSHALRWGDDTSSIAGHPQKKRCERAATRPRRPEFCPQTPTGVEQPMYSSDTTQAASLLVSPKRNRWEQKSHDRFVRFSQGYD